ncbi:hypothetical protein D3C72_745050 [compost metagenome]
MYEVAEIQVIDNAAHAIASTTHEYGLYIIAVQKGLKISFSYLIRCREVIVTFTYGLAQDYPVAPGFEHLLGNAYGFFRYVARRAGYGNGITWFQVGWYLHCWLFNKIKIRYK